MLSTHSFLPRSYANGPGPRAVLWTQGCSLGCPACFNPETHPFDRGNLLPIAKIAETILDLRPGIEGVTITGGEPLQQIRPLLGLLELLRARSSLSILLFSGFDIDEINGMPLGPRLLDTLDVLIAGRYRAREHWLPGLPGPTDKTIHLLTGRYRLADLDSVPPAEAIIAPDGEIRLTGLDPLRMNHA